MRSHHRFDASFRLSPSMVLLMLLFVFLWLAGGASRADALGQIVVRGISWAALTIAILFGPRRILPDVKPALAFLTCALLLVLLQLVPLPPAVWQSLPGHGVLAQAAIAAGEAQPWRPLSIVPGATWNSASSLVVPFTVLVLVAGLDPHERPWLPRVLLGFVTASAIIGLLQFSGFGIANPFINDTPGEVSGSFANRNHFALFVAMGCLLVPAWAFLGDRRPHWRGPVAIGLILLFALVILASGSRAGMIVGLLALGTGFLLARRGLRRELRHAPRWIMPVLIVAIVATIAVFVVISVAADRAASINRVIAADSGEDLRLRALPTVMAMVRTYFPVGAGFGTFDPLFRMHEPFAMLKFTYFNHAHDDLLELLIEGGAGALLLLLAGAGWWCVASFRAWRSAVGQILPRLGSAILFLVWIASMFDYPVRTPMMMAIVVIAAVWLSGPKTTSVTPALPQDGA